MGVWGQELGSCSPVPLPRYMGTVLLGACWGKQVVPQQGGRCPWPRMGLGDAQGSAGVHCQHASAWREAQSAACSVMQEAE